MAHTIAVDLDGVIHGYSKGWHDGTMYDAPIKGSHGALARLVSQGFRIVIVTARMNPTFPDVEKQQRMVIDWLAQHGFQEDIHYHELTNNKPAAIAYIDDRAVAFKNWEQAIEDTTKLVPKR